MVLVVGAVTTMDSRGLVRSRIHCVCGLQADSGDTEMNYRHKKPKTGDVVGWVLVDRDGDPAGFYKTRKSAREDQKWLSREGLYPPYILGKVVKP